MGFLDFFRCDVAIDLGTANTVIIKNKEVVLDEPSIIAMERATNKVIAVGSEAMNMHEKTHDDLKTIRPLKDGVIADFYAAEHMIKGMLKMIHGKNKNMFSPIIRKMVICIPSGITEVEKRAVNDSAENTGAREVYMVKEPIAAAVGIGIDISQPNGNMIIDIGGGTAEIAVISLSGIVKNSSIKTAGDAFTLDILEHIKRKHNLLIGERTAEKIKIEVGSATTFLENPPENMKVAGRDLATGKPKIIEINYKETAEALNASVAKIEHAILNALESTPPTLIPDINQNGIHLTGGGALLKGLKERIAKATELNVSVPNDPLYAVVKGTGIILSDIKKYASVLTK